MVRSFTDEPVDSEIVQRALAHAVRAPSAGFSQGWDFVVLDTPDAVGRFWSAGTDPEALAEPDAWLTGMRPAPVVILPCATKGAYLERYAAPDKGWTDRDEARWPMPYWQLDTAMAALLILLTATDEGLGACFFGIPPERADDVRAAFGIPAGAEPIGAIALGHPSPRPGATGSPSRRARRPLDEVVHRGSW